MSCIFSLLFSNGANGYTTEYYHAYKQLARFGISVYAWDYPGYKLSSGSPNYASVMEAGRAVLHSVAAHSTKQPEDVILMGFSLGGAVSLTLAQEVNSKALVLVNSLDSLQRLLGDCCLLSGWATGLHFATNHFDASGSLSQFHGCLFQYAAENDVIVYFKRQRKMFYDFADHKRKNCSVFSRGEDLGHMDWRNDVFFDGFHLYLQKLSL